MAVVGIPQTKEADHAEEDSGTRRSHRPVRAEEGRHPAAFDDRERNRPNPRKEEVAVVSVSENGVAPPFWSQAAFDRMMDRVLHFLETRTGIQAGAICAACLLGPWFIFATVQRSGGFFSPVAEALSIVPIAAVLVLVIPRFPRRRTRSILVGLYAVLINCLLAEFAYMYWSLSGQSPRAFSEPLGRLDAVYVAIGTFTTAGSGIDAVSMAARVAVMAQLVLGFGAVAVGVATALSSPAGKPRGPDGAVATVT